MTEDRIKLTKAFRAIRKMDIVARQNYLDCTTCAAYALYEIARAKGKDGIAYYHWQDTDAAKETGELYIGFGATSDSKLPSWLIGSFIARAFQDAGLVVEWDEDEKNRILVRVKWQ